MSDRIERMRKSQQEKHGQQAAFKAAEPTAVKAPEKPPKNKPGKGHGKPGKASGEAKPSPPTPKKAKKPGKPFPMLYGRLPDFSAFVVNYDAAKREWWGKLRVVIGDKEFLFDGACSSVFALLSQLDRKWRATPEGMAFDAAAKIQDQQEAENVNNQPRAGPGDPDHDSSGPGGDPVA